MEEKGGSIVNRRSLVEVPFRGRKHAVMGLFKSAN